MADLEKLDCNVGPIHFIRGSSVAYCVKLRKHHDPGVEFMMYRYRDRLSHFFDIGANVGLFSILASRMTDAEAKIVAFEPDEDNIKGFRKNMDELSLGNIWLEEVAVSNNGDPLRLGKVDCGLARKSSVEMKTIACRTIDSFVAEALIEPTFIKIDVEGFEWEVIEGTIATLSKNCAIVELEFSYRDLGHKIAQIREVFSPNQWVLECHLRDFDRDLLLDCPILRPIALRAKHIETVQVFWPLICENFAQLDALFGLLQRSSRQDPSRKWELLFVPRDHYRPLALGVEEGFEVREEL